MRRLLGASKSHKQTALPGDTLGKRGLMYPCAGYSGVGDTRVAHMDVLSVPGTGVRETARIQ